MDKKEKEVLKKMKNHSTGLLNESELINCLPEKDTKLSNSLIASGFIEETKRMKANRVEVTFYRLTEKGRLAIAPLYKKLWFYIKSDVKTIIISIITATIIALITTIITIWVTKLLNK